MYNVIGMKFLAKSVCYLKRGHGITVIIIIIMMDASFNLQNWKGNELFYCGDPITDFKKHTYVSIPT